MRFIKPQCLGLLVRPIAYGGAYRLGIAGLTAFDLDRPETLLPEAALWDLVGRELGADGVIDAGIPKACGEVLVVGHAYPPSGPAPHCPVRVQAGPIDKTIYAIGDRRWRDGLPTEPEPFERMPLTWERAYGGEGFSANPSGRGYAPEGVSPARLPNLERPGQLIATPRDRPWPAGLGPLDPMWAPRAQRAGTYDDEWLKTEYPGFASDVDWRYFNVAPDDQHLGGSFAGGEPIALTNLHPERARIVSSVPGHQLRCLVKRGEATQDVALAPTTLWLFPGSLRGAVVYHGWAAIESDDAGDVDCLLLAAEDRRSPRLTRHYMAELERRSSRERAALAVLDDTPLVPEGHDGSWSPGEGPNLEGRLLARAEQRRTKQFEDARARVVAMGLDPDEFAPEPPAPVTVPSLQDLPIVAEQLRADAERRLAEEKARLDAKKDEVRRMLEAAGVDPGDFIPEEDADPPVGPPSFRAEAERQRLRELAAATRATGMDASFIDELADGPAQVAVYEDTEQKLGQLYRASAHHNWTSRASRSVPSAAPAAALLERVARGESVGGVDFTGVILEGADLAGADLSGAYLEGAVLRGCTLRGARLSEAVLAGATIERCDLAGAALASANLGRVLATDSDLREAALDGAILAGATIERCDLRSARLDSVDLTEAALLGCDLRGAALLRTVLMKARLEGSTFAGALLHEAAFLELDVRGLDFEGATLENAIFYACDASGARFTGANMTSARFIQAARLDRAELSRAKLGSANLRGASMVSCVLTGAVLDGADLSEADLTGANLDGARLRGALMIRTKLLGASMKSADLLDALASKADLRRADLEGASLHGADLSLTQREEAVLARADLTRVRFVPEARR